MDSIHKPAVVLLSGGLDSSVLLHLIAKELQHAPVYALSFNYDQRHLRELRCAEVQATAVGVTDHRIIDMSFLGDLLRDGSALIAGGAPVPDMAALDVETLKQPPTYVPNRNMMLLSMAAAYAETRGVQHIYYGAQAQDDYGYWDCTDDFLQHMNQTLALNRRNAVTIHAPLLHNSKADNIALGQKLGVDFAQTWSCYRGEEKPCGACPTCVDRLKAFEMVGLQDPLTCGA
jgi:7-cyano-7-deazaguanine synthase